MPGDSDHPRLSQAAPSLLAALGVRWQGGGQAPREAPYTEEEEAQVAARLRAMGYLE